MELKTELKTATFDIIQILSEFTFLFWLDNFEHIDEKRIEFGETFLEEIENLNDELRHIWDGEYYSPNFESTLKVCSDSINYKQGLEDYVQITDQGQIGSSSFSLSKTLTNTSTPKDVQVNTSLQSKQKSTMKPDKPLTPKIVRKSTKRCRRNIYFRFRRKRKRNKIWELDTTNSKSES